MSERPTLRRETHFHPDGRRWRMRMCVIGPAGATELEIEVEPQSVETWKDSTDTRHVVMGPASGGGLGWHAALDPHDGYSAHRTDCDLLGGQPCWLNMGAYAESTRLVGLLGEGKVDEVWDELEDMYRETFETAVAVAPAKDHGEDA